jgi:hypothetical protein
MKIEKKHVGRSTQDISMPPTYRKAQNEGKIEFFPPICLTLTNREKTCAPNNR